MEIGKLKHRIKIYEVKNVINDEGGTEEITQTIVEPFCEVSKTTIKEFRNEDIDSRKETIIFIIRYRRDIEIHSGLNVDFKGKIYKIVAIETDFQDMERQQLKCEVVE
ncbi:phage head completion protein [Staphylococcus agnetis]|uniref:phage head completion protein n=1 Tax=Staphylococcus agnetis TaxID=985762 RepID=UPI0007210623|nr:head-tail adaptor protein [Staphylococcus agnetis]ALN76065.1 head-tail adaptor protein [Staphylococcus agnetis]NJI12028.1 hypothetical protein [Staphylococcus agnetis]